MTQPNQKAARGRPKSINTEQVLDVAIEAYWHGDPADVSVNSICQMAGVAKPSLYREFDNEDGLTLAALNRYTEQVLADIFAILNAEQGLRETLNALIDFACDDPRMETGCLFYKMRAGKHRLGPKTRAKVDELDQAAKAAYSAFMKSRQTADDWPNRLTTDAGARYLSEQVGLAITQRASGEDQRRVREMLELALSVLDPPR